MELVYPMKTSDLYFKFLNWLLGEFDLYQCEIYRDCLTIQYPLVKCSIKKDVWQNRPIAIVKIKGQSLKDNQHFLNYIEDLYNLFKKRYLIIK